MPRKRGRRGVRYAAADKARILAAARKEGLTALQVQRKFGVSPLTFYRWRGPVRGRRGPGRPPGGAAAGNSDLRAQVQDRVRAVLPGVIREEVNAYLASILGRRGPGRPRGTGRGPGRPRGSGRGPGRPPGSGRRRRRARTTK
ncbi:MAG TPA: transposase [Candidatus Eisenbacteria bacterium]|nr:transposase [Candidatus Eisenbacteria bacterium]